VSLIFRLRFRMFERCEEELVPFVVLVFAGSIVLGHYRDNQSLEFGDVGVNGVCSEFAHKHELGFESEFVLASGGSVLFLERREEFSGCRAVFHASFVLEIDSLG
jgi:hypothetical protein